MASKTLVRVLRYFIASVLLLTGIGKLLDVPGFIKVIETYQIVPSSLQPAVAVSMVLIELKIAENLFRSLSLKLTALAATALHIGFTFLATITLIRGIEVPNCGCFGVFWARPLTYITVGEDIFMVGICFLLLKTLQNQETHLNHDAA
ncbi:MAG: MauE/DoxX family redox-associated membrane protein [Nitrospinota bacterium]